MKIKRTLSLMLALVMLLSVLGTWSVLTVAAEDGTEGGSGSDVGGTAGGSADTDVTNAYGYVADGLVALYSGTQNTREGHDTASTVWEDLVGGHDFSITANEKNYFTESGLSAEGAQHNLPSAIVDVVNGQEFTVEILFSEFASLGVDFNTFLNSSNDHFALFRRISTDQIEFKFAANGGSERHKIDDGLNLLQNALITVTYRVGGTSCIYINGQLMAEKSSPNVMGANDLYFGHASGQKSFSTTFRSLRFYDRALSAGEVLQNGMTDGVASLTDAYVQDGLVSLYNGMVTGDEADVWEDLVGENDIPVTIDANNYFGDGGYVHTNVKNLFPQAIVDLVNGDEFTLEFRISGLAQGAAAYCTLISSDNDNFALFRRNDTDELEFKFAGNTGPSRNKVPGCMELLQDALVTVTYKVGGQSSIYINGVLQSTMNAPSAMGADNLFFGHSQADRYFDATFHDIRFYNRALSDAEVKANARADGFEVSDSEHPTIETPGYVTVAQPVTHIVGDISMVRRINTADELAKLLAAEQKPATAIYTINDELEVLSDKGAVISTVSEVLTATEFKVLSAFYVKDTATAEALTAYLKSIRFYDCFVVSADPAVVKAARTTLPNISGVIDYTSTYKDADALTEAQCLDIRRSMKVNNGTIAILPASVCSKDTVQYLYERQVNVWAQAADSPSQTAQYTAILSGAIGVISDATDSLLDIACHQLPANTMTRMALNVGHRGIPSKAPENTIEGSLTAYEQGANVIELDVYLTTDGHVVVMHDGTTGRTCNADLAVENSTLAQLKELYVNKGYESGKYSECRIPTLEEYLETFKGKDCSLFIEIKSSKRAIIAATKALVDEYDMYGQCTVITFHETILSYMREDWPEMHGGLLCGDLMTGTTAEAGLRNAMNTVGKYNATINPSSGGYDGADMRAALQRGISIYPWTFRGDFSVYQPYFLWGYSGLTGDYADVFRRMAHQITTTWDASTYRVGDTLPLSLVVTYFNHKSTEETSTVTVLSGDEHIRIENGTLTFTGNGEVTLLLAYTQSVQNGESYTIYTTPITLTVEEETTTPPETEPETTVAETSPATGETAPDGASTTDGSSSDEVDDSGTAAAKGCSSVVGGVTILLLAVAAIVPLRKKKED